MPDTPVAKLTEKEAKAELKRLGEAIRRADAAYYQDDAPELTDAEYDKLRLRLGQIEAKFPELKRVDSPSETVGVAPTGAFGKVRHLKPMLSLDNIFSDEEVTALRAWTQQVASRRGKRMAIVALARRLMRILFAMWRDERGFVPKLLAA